MSAPPSFAPLTADALAQAQARRAEGEAEIARREAALAEAEARLQAAHANEASLRAELDVRRSADDQEETRS
jgi:hypothetical protein